MAEHVGQVYHHAPEGTRALQVSLGIVLGMMVLEVVGGLLSHSLALLSDAGHMLVDGLALGLSLFALTVARRPASLTRTYGYHRVEIMAALTNGVTLVVVSLVIFYEAYQRFLKPPEVRAPIMLAVAVVGLLANLIGIVLLRRSSLGSLNVKAAFWHVIGDTVSSVGVIAAGVIIAVTGWYPIDPIVAVLIAGIIMWGAVRLVTEASDILLEAAPRHVQPDRLVERMKSVPGVLEVHDLHIWTITSGIYAVSAHLLIEDQMVSRSAEIVQAVTQDLEREFHISHSTLQLECARCEACPSGLMCEVRRSAEQAHADQHT